MKIRNTVLLLSCAFLMTTISCKDSKKEKEEAEKMEMAQKEAEEKAAKEAEMKKKEEMRASSIAGKAMNSQDLDTLVIALKAAGLDGMMAEAGSYTVFAPTDNAFSKLDEGALDELLKEENKEQLKSVLQGHVVSSKITSDKLVEAINGAGGEYTFQTVNGSELTAMMKGDQIMIKDGRGKTSQVVQGNIEASNGIVHVVNDVLMAKK